MKIINKRVLAMAMGCLFSMPAWSQLACDKSYGFRVDVLTAIGTSPGSTLCASKSQVFIDATNNFNYSNSAYNQASATMVYGRFNDVSVELSYDANTRTLKYNFRELGIGNSFTGTSRAESQDMFVEYVKKQNIIGKIMQYQAMHSATSPIAGVGGIIPMAGGNDFSASFDTQSKVAAAGKQDGASANNLIGLSMVYGSYNVSGSGDRVSTINLPLSYTIRNDIDPRRQLVFSMPLGRVAVGDAISYQGGLGVAYRLPISDQWTLTPGGKYSVVASKDRATLSSVMSVNLMSTYLIPLASFDVAIGNMLGYYKTGKFSNGDYAFNPDVALTMTRNGIMLSSPTSIFGSKMAAEYSFIDTRYLGTKPFVSNTQEIGVTIGTNKNATNARSFMRGGVSYLRGKDTRGFQLNYGYWF